MFGNPLVSQKTLVGAAPCVVERWLYAGVWVGVICLPFVACWPSSVVGVAVWVCVMMWRSCGTSAGPAGHGHGAPGRHGGRVGDR